MIKYNDKILVVDLEETCWEGNMPPPDEESEIIQIGWVFVDLAKATVGEKGQVLIKPQQSKVSEYCTKLTGITPKMTKGGIPFEHACKYLVHKLGCRSRAWAAWGNDKATLDKQCKMRDCDSPFSDAYLNLQLLTAIWIGPIIKPRPGLEEMVSRFRIEPCGPLHRADNDAWMAASILVNILSAQYSERE